MDYFERKKLKEETEKYRTMCRILAVIIVILALLWWRSDDGRVKLIHELQDQITEYEEEINDLKKEVEGWKEEAMQ